MDGQHEICIYTRQLGVIKSELLNINLQYKLEIYKLAIVILTLYLAIRNCKMKSCNCLLNCIIP